MFETKSKALVSPNVLYTNKDLKLKSFLFTDFSDKNGETFTDLKCFSGNFPSTKQSDQEEEEPEPTEPDGVGVGDLLEILAGHGHVGEVLEAEVAGALSQRVQIHIRNGRLRRAPALDRRRRCRRCRFCHGRSLVEDDCETLGIGEKWETRLYREIICSDCTEEQDLFVFLVRTSLIENSFE